MKYAYLCQLDRDRQGEWIIIFQTERDDYDEWTRVPGLDSFVSKWMAKEYRDQFLKA